MKYLLLLAAMLAPAPKSWAAALQQHEPGKVCSEHPCLEAAPLVGEIDQQDAEEVEALVRVAAHDQADAVVLAIHSIGGDFGASKRIYDAIKSSPVPFYCYVSGTAASGAFWVLQACRERVAETTAMLMVHQAYFHFSVGTPVTRTDLADLLSKLDAMNDVMFSAVAPRMGLKTEELAAKCLQSGNWYFSGKSALAYHVVDALVPSDLAAYIEHVKSSIRKP